MKLWNCYPFATKLLLIISISFSTAYYDFKNEVDEDSQPLPPLENEWGWENPNIFSLYPKPGIEEIKHQVKLESSNPYQKYLPRTTKPSEYSIRLRVILESELDEEELTAPGSVRIVTKCLEATKEFVLHARTKYLTILEDTVKVTEKLLLHDTNSVPVVNQTYDEPNDFYIIHLATECQVNREYYIDIDFIAAIADDTLTGLYLSTYTDPVTNVTKRLATTQFEAEFARNMFPHYDDPDFKAVFKIIIGRYKDYNSLSNMNIVKTEVDSELSGWLWDLYAPTPVMSSYLVALVVSDFISVSAPSPGYKKGVEIFAPPYMIERGGGNHSAQVVATILQYYDGFMKQPYPLPKMASVAIPDFQAGAMENWGLNTYRIKGLIFYPGITSEENRLRIELTIAHELAHQNFGNLVTCKFWNQIWLNEGFATYISYYGLKSVSSEFDPDTQWLTYRRRALFTDAYLKTHPLVNVSNQMYYFDGISYSKGASLLRMMENFLTERVFHEGLQMYLKKYAYGTATQWDLFDVLDTRAFSIGVHPAVATVSEIMETWTLQKGYPLIRVEYISNRVIALTQERFIDSQMSSVEDEEITGLHPQLPTFWYIPITLQHDKTKPSKGKSPHTWLTNMEQTKIIYLEQKFEYIVVNSEAAAYARVLYDEKSARLIEKLLQTSHSLLSPVSRAQLIEDAFETAWAGYGKIETALDFTQYLHLETEPVVWTSATNGFGRIYSMLINDDEGFALFKNYIFDKVSSALTTFGFGNIMNAKGIQIMHLASMLSWAGALEISDALQHAGDALGDWAETANNRIAPDLHVQTYCNAIIGGNRSTYDTVLTFLQSNVDEDIQQALAKGLGCSTDASILNEYLLHFTAELFRLKVNLTQSEFLSSLPSSINYEIMIKLARNSITRQTLIPYLDENFEYFQEYFGGIGIFVRTFEAATQYWNKREEFQKVENFFEKHKDEFQKVRKRIKRILAQIQKNILWVERFASAIKTWLTKTQ